MISGLLAGRYEVDEDVGHVGHGGQATVLRAVDRQHDRVVALKVFACDSDAQREALLAEARVLLGVSPHPALPMLRDDFFVDRHYVIVMDWIAGRDLQRELAEHGEPGLDRSIVVDCVTQVAMALDHLHSHRPSIVHGDVKPGNLIRAADGRISLVDFGIAAAEQSTQRAGSRGYIAPEVAAHGLLTPAADVYGLAATASALLTGRPPDGTRPLWEGIDPAEVGALARVLKRGLATDPARRPPTAGAFAERLRAGRFQALPTGTVTFLSNDVASASTLWDAHSDDMVAAVDRLDDLVAEVVDVHGGRLLRSTGGDGWLSVFREASHGAAAALDLHGRVATERWPKALELRLRAALHSGEAQLRDGDYHGRAVHVTGRLLTCAPPGTTIVSHATRELMSHPPHGAVLFELDATAADEHFAGGRLHGLVADEAQRFELTPAPSEVVGSELAWLLCTDVEDSTRLLQASPDRYRAAIDRYRRVLAETCAEFDGMLLSSVEDLAVMVVPGPTEAIGAALAAQQTLAAAPEDVAVRVRMGIHAERVDPDSTEPASSVATTTAVTVCRAGHGGQVLVSEQARRSAVTSLAAGAALLDLGEHRLGDLALPHRLFQLAHPVLGTDFPPPRSIENRAHNLPVQLTRFFGRQHEVAQLAELLSANRLCTITGTGGAGKTRLALQVAAEALSFFPDGVWWADLAGVADGDVVASALAAELGVREGGSGTFAAPRQQRRRSAVDRIVDHLEFGTALVVLDNCEHVVGHVVEVVEQLLRRCPRVRILATSRESLAVAGELTYRLGPLELPTANAEIGAIRECSSVRLFVDRALLRRPDLSLSDGDIVQVASICQRVDGIPFAIELAAARVNLLGIAAVAANLNEHLDLLSGAAHSTSARQPTLRAMIEWSDDLLTDRERTLLRRLSVFAGGFDLEAARHVCAGGALESFDVLELLAALVEKSLLETEPVSGRFRLLEVTRQYAADRLRDADEDEALRAAHRAWFLTLAERAETELTTGDQGRWLDLLEADQDNLLVALASGRDASNGDDARLASALSQFWLVRGRLSEGRSWLEEALSVASPPDALRAKTLCVLGMLCCFAGDYERAVEVAGEARTIAERIDSRRWDARARSLLGLAASGQGRLAEAELHHRPALDGARATGDWWFYAFVLNNLGNVLAPLGAIAAARAAYEESVAVRRQHGDVWGMTWALFRLGALGVWEGRFAAALGQLDEALDLATSIRFGQGVLLAQIGLGDALHACRRHHDAGLRYADALSTARQHEEDTSVGIALAGLAAAAVADGDLAAAARWLDDPGADADDDRRSLATRAALLSARAALYTARGDHHASLSLHLRSLRLREDLGDRRTIIDELDAVAVLFAGAGDQVSAATLFGTTDRWRSEFGLPVPPRQQPARDAALAMLDRTKATLDTARRAGEALSVEAASELARTSQAGHQ